MGARTSVFDDETDIRYIKVFVQKASIGKTSSKVLVPTMSCGARPTAVRLTPCSRGAAGVSCTRTGCRRYLSVRTGLHLFLCGRPPTRPGANSPLAGPQRVATASGRPKRTSGGMESMPDMRQACYALLRAEARGGRVDDARRTLERCQQIFPDAGLRAEMARLLPGPRRRGPEQTMSGRCDFELAGALALSTPPIPLPVGICPGPAGSAVTAVQHGVHAGAVPYLESGNVALNFHFPDAAPNPRLATTRMALPSS